jgi:hypothetical protein
VTAKILTLRAVTTIHQRTLESIAAQVPFVRAEKSRTGDEQTLGSVTAGVKLPSLTLRGISIMDNTLKERLEYIRGELRAERISYGELVELQDLAAQGKIDSSDNELLEAAGVPETE